MLNFKAWYENQFVYRIDKDPIKDFSLALKTYHRSPDWSSSGTFDDKEKIPSDWVPEKGLFAGDMKSIIPYATPRDTKWIVTYETPHRPTVFFNQSDRQNIRNYRPYLSKFTSAAFTKVPSGEFFSSDPKSPVAQQLIRKPKSFIERWYEVNFVPNLEQLAKSLRAQKIHFDSEGI